MCCNNIAILTERVAIFQISVASKMHQNVLQQSLSCNFFNLVLICTAYSEYIKACRLFSLQFSWVNIIAVICGKYDMCCNILANIKVFSFMGLIYLVHSAWNELVLQNLKLSSKSGWRITRSRRKKSRSWRPRARARRKLKVNRRRPSQGIRF